MLVEVKPGTPVDHLALDRPGAPCAVTLLREDRPPQIHHVRRQRAEHGLGRAIHEFDGVGCLIQIDRALGLTHIFDEIEEIERSEEHTSELQSLMRISYAVFCLKKKTTN